ncbi:MAG: hypothetical protein F6K54_05555 [Okeania sp. SIO3B5]|uniref:hypothetical protein n=1 Tax=Okeania sp. SIO3B5 TaxID=2607811 RepID=UPI001401950E|nr:hypothetical protein [Okeania sp. SIO3B5]NEO52585.1 hypothetical protein [Okeania sp. SIO3B5]
MIRKTRIPTDIWIGRIKKVLGDWRVQEHTDYGVILTNSKKPSKPIKMILNRKEDKATIVVNQEEFIFPRGKIDDFEEKLWEHHPDRI